MGVVTDSDPDGDSDVDQTLTFNIKNKTLSQDVKEDMSKFLHSNSETFLKNMSDLGSRDNKLHKVKTGLYKAVTG